MFHQFVVPSRRFQYQAQMAESVDALVSNTSGATHPGSIPGLGTRKGRFSDLPFLVPAAGAEPVPFFSSPQRTGRPSGTALARILASPQYVISRVRGGRDGWTGRDNGMFLSLPRNLNRWQGPLLYSLFLAC